MYSNYYGNMVPVYRQGYGDERWFLAAPIAAAGLLGLGVGYLGGLVTPRPCCYPPYGAGFGGYGGFGPGFGGYGGFGTPFMGGPGFY